MNRLRVKILSAMGHSRTAVSWLAALGGLALASAIAVLPSQASASTNDFLGRWMNFQHDSSGITGMVITPGRGGLNIRVVGLCREEPVCDWDVAQANLYSSVSRSMWTSDWGDQDWGGFRWAGGGRDVSVITANFDAGYARKFMVIQRSGPSELRVQIFTDFRGGYGRQGYFSESRLQRWGRGGGYGGYGPGDQQ